MHGAKELINQFDKKGNWPGLFLSIRMPKNKNDSEKPKQTIRQQEVTSGNNLRWITFGTVGNSTDEMVSWINGLADGCELTSPDAIA